LPDAEAFDQAVKPLWTCPKCGHLLPLASPEEIDGDLEALLREAYAVGRQEHLAGRRTSR
jgi:pimeloyl-ACP methyl ester carboxylesterase